MSTGPKALPVPTEEQLTDGAILEMLTYIRGSSFALKEYLLAQLVADEGELDG